MVFFDMFPAAPMKKDLSSQDGTLARGAKKQKKKVVRFSNWLLPWLCLRQCRHSPGRVLDGGRWCIFFPTDHIGPNPNTDDISSIKGRIYGLLGVFSMWEIITGFTSIASCRQCQLKCTSQIQIWIRKRYGYNGLTVGCKIESFLAMTTTRYQDWSVTTRSDARMTQENPTATVKDTVLPLVTEGLMNRGISIDLFVSTGAENADAAIAFFYSIAHDSYQQQPHKTECICKEGNQSLVYICFPVPFLLARKRCQDRSSFCELIVCKTKKTQSLGLGS